MTKMRGHKALVSFVVAVVMVAALSGCGGKSETQFVEEGRSALERGESAQSLVPLRAALSSNPDSAEARFLLGTALLRTDQPALAAIELQKARDLRYDPNSVLPALAQALLSSGQAGKVDALTPDLVTDTKAKAALHAARAAALALAGDTAGGRVAVDAALALDAANIQARMLLVRLLAGQGKGDDAFAALGVVLAAEPKLADAVSLRGDLLLALKADTAGAEAAFKAALAIDPAHLGAHTSLLGLYEHTKNAPALNAQLLALQKVHPNHTQTQFHIARAELQNKNYAKAREAVQRLLLVTPDYPYVLQLAGAIESEAGALTMAETRLSRALYLAPELGTARYLLAEIQVRRGNAVKALQTLQPMLAAAQPRADVLSLAGQAHLQNRNPQAAIQMFSAAAKANPDDQKARAALALVQIGQGRKEEGFALLQKSADSDPGTYADLALFSARLQAGDPDGAMKAAQALERKMTGQALPLMLQAQVLLEQDKLADARARFEKALSLVPDHAPAALALAALDVRENKRADAQRRLEAFLVRVPDHLQASMGVAELQLEQGRSPDQVLAQLAEIVRKHPAEIGPRVVQVNLLLRERRVEAAMTAAQAALAAFPDHPEALDGLSRAQLAAGSTEQALGTLRKLVSLAPTDPMPLVRLGNTYLAAQNLKLAEQSFRRAADINPALREAAAGMVQVALLDKRPDDALKAARALQRARPNDVLGLVMEGEIQLGRRLYAPAMEAFRAAMARSDTVAVAQWVYTTSLRAGRVPDAEQFGDQRMRAKPRDGEFLHFLALQAIERKDWPVAERRLRDLQNLLPDNPAAPNNLAWVLMQQGKPGALEHAQRANVLLPGNSGLLDTLAMAQAADKQWAEAVSTQQKAVEKAPAVAELRLRLAKYQIAAGDKAAARGVLEQLASQAGELQAEARTLLQGL